MSMWTKAPRPARVLVIAGVSLAMLAACGGSDDTASSSGSSSGSASGSVASEDSSPSAAAAPADPVAAEAEVRKNWETFFLTGNPPETSLALLEDADQLGEALQIAAKLRDPNAKQSAAVKKVTFTSETEADVTYDLSIGGTVVLPGAQGKAVLQDGTWKVSRTTFCTLTALGAQGQTIPGCS